MTQPPTTPEAEQVGQHSARTVFGHQVILTAPEVREIRLFHDSGWTRIRGNWRAIALAYGIAYQTAKQIGSRHNWWWLEEGEG